MISGFDKIVEERIKKGQREGAFKNLPGAGKPLKFEDSNIPEDLRMAYKILKNADCLPPEIELRKQIRQTEDLLSGMQDTAERYKILKKLNYLILKLNAAGNASMANEMPQYYIMKMTEALNSKKKSAGKK